MGQHWRFVNIDRRERLDLEGKLGEIFYDEFSDVMGLLAGSWAGCRIMCIGHYMRECPPNVLTSEEVSEIISSESEDDSTATLYDFTYTYWELGYRGYINLRGMVLRNLTRHVYVRRDVVVARVEQKSTTFLQK
ncbi:hypothetical protein EDD85DRAFT_863682 [Armillaria nabsnona]|nr:hypothetical protein EDD85DRAFT_863682 [Armillaria nabsnona]